MNLTPEEIKAVDECIDHWQKDMVEPLEAGKKIGLYETRNFEYYLVWRRYFLWLIPLPLFLCRKLKCYAESCSLCFLTGYVGEVKGQGCPICPYTTYYRSVCLHGHWGDFIDNPCLETAQAMVDALKAIKAAA